MDIKNINYLFAIEELQSISAASRRLYISQPSLSQFLKKYEEDLGSPIFIRTKQGLRLTEEGRIFLDAARNILQLERDMRNRLCDMTQTLSGTIVFAVSAQRAPFLLPSVLPEFRRRHPLVRVNVVEKRTKDLENELKKGGIDLGIVAAPLTGSSLDCEVFMDEEIVIAVPRDMPLSARIHCQTGRLPWIDPRELADHTFLLYDINNMLYDFADELFTRCQFYPSNSLTYQNLTLIARLASAGMGITFLPETFTDPSYGLDYYSIGEEGCFRPLALGYPFRHYRSKGVEEFSLLLKETMLAEQTAFRERYSKRL